MDNDTAPSPPFKGEGTMRLKEGVCNCPLKGEGTMRTNEGVCNCPPQVQLLIAGSGSLAPWLREQGAVVVPYYAGILDEMQNAGGMPQRHPEYKKQNEGNQ